MKYLLTLAALCVFFCTQAQIVHVKAQLQTEDQVNPMGSFVIYHLPDSGIVRESYVDSVYFSALVPLQQGEDYFIRFAFFEFSDTLVPFTVEDTVVNLGTLPIQYNLLDAVEVVYTKPAFERTMDGISVEIEGTTLETLDNLFEVLKASPKIYSPDDEKIQIIGMGSPLILIDRQNIITLDELKAIPADQIERIEIMTNPPAKYAAQSSGGGVIEVYTKNYHLEGYNVTLRGAAGVNSQGIGNNSLSGGINGKKNKFSVSGYFRGNSYGSNNYSTSNSQSTDGSELTSFSDRTGKSQNMWGYGNIKASYRQNDKNTFNAGLRLSLSEGNSESDYYRSYSQYNTLITEEINNSSPDYVWNSTSGFVNFVRLIDTLGSSMEFNFNQTLKINESDNITQSIFEDKQNDTYSIFQRKTDEQNRPNISDIRWVYDKKYGENKWNWSTGVNANLIWNDKSFDQYDNIDQQWVIDSSFSNSYNYREQLIGAFVEVNKQWEKFSLRIGLRGETTILDGYSESMQRQFIDSNYTVLLPSISLMYNISTNTSIDLSYQTGIDRPSFDNFDPFVRIEDSLNISYGNPYLLPSPNHAIGAEISFFNSYSIGAGYEINYDPVSTIQLVNDTSFLVSSVPWNADYNTSWSVFMGAPINTKFMRAWNYIWLDFNYYQFTAEFQRAPLRNTNFGASSYMTFYLPKDFSFINSLYIYQYNSDQSVKNLQTQWNVRLNKKFKDIKLNLFAAVNNLVPPTTQTTTYSGNFISESTAQYQFTSYQLGLTYKFGRLKRAVNIKESESSQSDRM